ncbi:SPX domain-containing protein [Paramyrothecium foliicola]|nr:SPX domain-containing protein [Paramyrothecium foliicola]
MASGTRSDPGPLVAKLARQARPEGEGRKPPSMTVASTSTANNSSTSLFRNGVFATAMVIPGHQDTALTKFEERLFQELCSQHERVDLFVKSKGDEIERRLEHLSRGIQRFRNKTIECADPSASFKRQRRFAKYERELRECGDDIHALSRFAGAQIVAFRKIIKKYKKWTGSTTLGSRFSKDVLNHPRSFTRKDFGDLQTRYDAVSRELQAAAPLSVPSSPDAAGPPSPELPRTARRPPQVTFDPLPPPEMQPASKYWNEYDNGSEAGDQDDYAIYVNPEEDASFPGLDYINSIFSPQLGKVKAWFRGNRSLENRPLLFPEAHDGYLSSSGRPDSDTDEVSSNDGLPTHGYATFHAFPSVNEQKAIRYREKALFFGTIGCFAASYTLLFITSFLILTGKHKLRIEVDAAVTVGVVISLFCAGSALGMTFYRHDPITLVHRAAVWLAFVAACLANGMLLVLVVGNTP